MMKKVMLMALALISIPIIMQAATATITLNKSFTSHPGTYKFELDVDGAAVKEKTWNLIISKDRKLTLKNHKGIQGKNISIKGNVIKAQIGTMKKNEGKDLKIHALDGDLKAQFATTELSKESRTYNVAVGPGLTLSYLSAPKAKGHTANYHLESAHGTPDGSYTCKLLRPGVEAHHDKVFNFNVKNHKIVKVTGDKEGKLSGNRLAIDARQMCEARRAIEAVTIAGTAAAMILGAVATGGLGAAIAPVETTAEATTAALQLAISEAVAAGATADTAQNIAFEATVAGVAAGTISGSALSASAVGAITGSVAAATGVAAASLSPVIQAIEEGKGFGASPAGAMFGFKDATLQITCVNGPAHYKNQGVKVDYEECRDNTWVLNAIHNKILITSK